jgi:MerR family transcriptional regulator/heat shock protein HspR
VNNKEDAGKPIYPIRVAAKLLGVSIPTLRLYEKEGLIIPFKKDSRQRLFSHQDIQRLLCIRAAINQKKISIAGIKMLFAMIPCWSIKKCSEADRQHCDSFTASSQPCWSFTHEGNVCGEQRCRDCEVYEQFTDCHSIKQTIIHSSSKQ